MKNFNEYIIEQQFKDFCKRINEFAGQAFVGGALQAANKQQFDPVAANTNPLNQQNQNSNIKDRYNKYLTNQQQKLNALKIWTNRSPVNYNVVNQHYGNNPQQFQSQLDQATKSWIDDEKENPNGLQSYLQKNLKLPQGSFK